MASKVILSLIVSLVCMAVLVSADSTEERERKAIYDAVDEASEAFARALDSRGLHVYAALQKRGWLSDAWDNVKQAASDFWSNNKQQIISTGINALLAG